MFLWNFFFNGDFMLIDIWTEHMWFHGDSFTMWFHVHLWLTIHSEVCCVAYGDNYLYSLSMKKGIAL